MMLWELARLNDAELQQLFDLAYCLHPHTATAWQVLIEAGPVAARWQKAQHNNPGGDKPYQRTTPNKCLFQLGLYLASESREKDQESLEPTQSPRYAPTRQDRAVRYLKLLTLEMMIRRSIYGAIGMGCFLYTYHPGDIEYMFEQLYNPGNLRRCKQMLLERIEERFQDAVERLCGARGTIRLRSRALSRNERPWVDSVRMRLCPWYPAQPAHIAGTEDMAAVFKNYFGHKAKGLAKERPILDEQ
ncbi:MAG: hypothetical protein FJZ47_14595 [Candidatus Tectomicrobia bacterium]|uniref:Uncharacterized protein n=1 Tax=Tectimicrobiota bacterium TaxID=2528274 RepID=A0A938B379_UNCTE|nr:hypothetical protein [Candidatus Tectomicrobia bacterium]